MVKNVVPLDTRDLVHTFPAPDDHIRTLYDNLKCAVKKFPKVRYLGYRPPKKPFHNGTSYGNRIASATDSGAAAPSLSVAPARGSDHGVPSALETVIAMEAALKILPITDGKRSPPGESGSQQSDGTVLRAERVAEATLPATARNRGNDKVDDLNVVFSAASASLGPLLGMGADQDRLDPLGPYVWMSYEQVWYAVSIIGLGMTGRFLRPSPQLPLSTGSLLNPTCIAGAVPRSGSLPASSLRFSETFFAPTAALESLPHPREHIGVFGANCKEWVLMEAAAHAFSAVVVPLYDELSAEMKTRAAQGKPGNGATEGCHQSDGRTEKASSSPQKAPQSLASVLPYIIDFMDLRSVACSVENLPVVLQAVREIKEFQELGGIPDSGELKKEKPGLKLRLVIVWDSRTPPETYLSDTTAAAAAANEFRIRALLSQSGPTSKSSWSPTSLLGTSGSDDQRFVFDSSLGIWLTSLADLADLGRIQIQSLIPDLPSPSPPTPLSPSASPVAATAAAGSSTELVDVLASFHCPPSASDLSYISCTSGTTGLPKGVMLSHANIVASVAGGVQLIPPGRRPSPGAPHLSYLPLAHVYERINLVRTTYLGGAVGFYGGVAGDALLRDARSLQPFMFVAVPRVYHRIRQQIFDEVRQWREPARQLFSSAFNHRRQKIEMAARGDAVALAAANADPQMRRLDELYDKVVFSRFREVLGGKVGSLVTGGSSLSGEVKLFLQVCFGVEVREGYGLTESSGAIASSRPGAPPGDYIGPPNPCCRVRIVVADADDSSDDRRDATAETVDGRDVTVTTTVNGNQHGSSDGGGLEGLLSLSSPSSACSSFACSLSSPSSSSPSSSSPSSSSPSSSPPVRIRLARLGERGEVQVCGPNVFSGYYKRPEVSHGCLDEEGWLRTGDVGAWVPVSTPGSGSGFVALQLLSRRGDVFKLSNGCFVSPEKIEEASVGRSRYVRQLYLYGDSTRDFLVAIAVPDKAQIEAFLQSRDGALFAEEWGGSRELKSKSPGSMIEGVKESEVTAKRKPAALREAVILMDLKRAGKEAGLKKFELAGSVRLCLEPFSVENGLLTPTLKMRRGQARRRFWPLILDMYDNAEAKTLAADSAAASSSLSAGVAFQSKL